jgi:hypothetical protein
MICEVAISSPETIVAFEKIGTHFLNFAAAENETFVSFGNRVLDNLEKKLVRKILKRHRRETFGKNGVECSR